MPKSHSQRRGLYNQIRTKEQEQKALLAFLLIRLLYRLMGADVRRWAWLVGIIEKEACGQVLETRLGWRVQSRWDKFRKHRMLQNFPMQANGADCLRLAPFPETEVGHRICAPVHDALVLIGEAETIHEEAQKAVAIMARAASTIARISVPIDCAITLPGERYNEQRGRAMFVTVLDLIYGQG